MKKVVLISIGVIFAILLMFNCINGYRYINETTKLGEQKEYVARVTSVRYDLLEDAEEALNGIENKEDYEIVEKEIYISEMLYKNGCKNGYVTITSGEPDNLTKNVYCDYDYIIVEK